MNQNQIHLKTFNVAPEYQISLKPVK